MFFNSNTIFVGLPSSIKPPSAMLAFPMFLSIICAIRPFSGPLGTYLIQRDGEGEAEFDLKNKSEKDLSHPL